MGDQCRTPRRTHEPGKRQLVNAHVAGLLAPSPPSVPGEAVKPSDAPQADAVLPRTSLRLGELVPSETYRSTPSKLRVAL